MCYKKLVCGTASRLPKLRLENMQLYFISVYIFRHTLRIYCRIRPGNKICIQRLINYCYFSLNVAAYAIKEVSILEQAEATIKSLVSNNFSAQHMCIKIQQVA
ncbi:hypothetical protein AUL39_08270 [Tractidigestivibacter scatoligenes]|uniref:Uncharacterized protein n=1 Tax=Tractidigestivibacter scatoligenes TaxID=1299998 RepID=A0A117J412_TRASO|nr:hypothetical protein AUL39_08270 [Tractidigestivibacter scatoligenes]